MSKTTQTVLVVIGVLVVLVLCACAILMGFYILGSNSQETATSVPSTQPVPTGIPTLQPTVQALPTVEPTSIVTQTSYLPYDSELNFDGKVLKIMSVVYSPINGGEEGVSISGPDQNFCVITLYSADKDLGFFYPAYKDTISLIDPSNNQSFDFDYMNWSLDDSPTNSGYLKISFAMSAPLTQAVLHVKDGMDVDLTPLLPANQEVQNPWIDVSQPFDFAGTQLQIQSINLYDNYKNPVTGEYVEKNNDSDKILTVELSSPQNDLSYMKEAAQFIVVDGSNTENQYPYNYLAWTIPGGNSNGGLIYIFVIPSNTNSLLLYVPFDTMIDLTPMVTNK